ncbi:hypothetical protein [Salinivibrio sp. YCSC6]|uniref:hypothetical protein n=1 Tax=Salinivibrio sp. YCSC6 TaxID=2003370 RepID=UPI0010A79AF3|nr:hypothetical protein [Salinivibrio sp. YCSC6]QCF35469.1 hypothetical protein E8E00_04365 [Salinivibrio sp. YCSC6]
MSDYIFSSKNQPKDYLRDYLKTIYKSNAPSAYEFHGNWGSLAVTKQHYNGFLPYENKQHLMLVIGGPILYFRDNDFLVEADSSVATKSIYDRWIVDGLMQWDEDLSGPFTIILVNKITGVITTVTDLMSFIPVYTCQKDHSLYLGTHVDVLASAAGVLDELDQVSLADFVLNGFITYPYTFYKHVRQSKPSCVTTFHNSTTKAVDCYWLPTETNSYNNLNQAAEALRVGIAGYVDRISEKMNDNDIAQFISAGEDSRALSGLLADRKGRDAYIFLDQMNREGRIAKKIAAIYDSTFNVGFRCKTHYLDIMPAASCLVGAGHQYFHAHSLGFDKKYCLSKYHAVFGGYFSDSLLKAAYAHKLKSAERFQFFPDFPISGESRTKIIKNPVIKDEILYKINNRRRSHYNESFSERPLSAHEWFVLRPASMRVAIPNLYSTRRLFKSYEPFMCKEAVKISAAVPTSWKLNRRLFNRAMKPYLKASKWTMHADGRLPYFSWWVNMPIQFGIWLHRNIAKRLGIIKGNQGPWGDWKLVFRDQAWKTTVDHLTSHRSNLEIFEDDVYIKSLLLSNELSGIQKINLAQTLYRAQSIFYTKENHDVLKRD